MRNVTLAATQFACSWDIDANIAAAEAAVRNAAAQGAQVILLQELFETPYFCIDQDPRHFALARSGNDSRVVRHFAALAKSLGVVLPISYFERAGPAFFNTLAVADADGRILGQYRKTHIPQNPGYEEKYYFSPGDTGFGVLDTRFGRIGCGICWDQWFPETARCLALKGAEMLLFPTAIGSEPADPAVDSSGHWRRVMQGHAAANIMPLVASNRVGTERGAHTEITFYGTSITATVDLDAVAAYRATWGVFRDRRPERYGALMTLDGRE
jgi:N-carbamoylputrescine amidase